MKTTILPVPLKSRKEIIKGFDLPELERDIMFDYAEHSTRFWTVDVDGTLICVFGLIEQALICQSAYLWVYGTPDLDRYKFVFARHSKEVLGEMLKQYPTIIGHCAVGDKSAQRWLRWLGAKFSLPTGKLVPFEVMAAPGVLGAVSIGSSLIGGIMQGEAKKQAADAQAKVYNYQAQVAQINSQIDKQNADFASVRGEQQAAIAGIKGAQQAAAIKVGFAASGVDVGSGSAADVAASQKKVTAMDINQIRANAAKTAYDYNVQSVEDLNQAGLDRMAASDASRAGDIAMAASLVSTAGSVSDKWLSASKSGMFGATAST
jgi:hypothetical protein